MANRVVVIDGHPDPAEGRLCHALADAYAKGAESAGHSVESDAKCGRWLQTMHGLGQRMR